MMNLFLTIMVIVGVVTTLSCLVLLMNYLSTISFAIM